VHDRGRVLADTAVMIAEGGRVPGALPEAVLEELLGRRNASTWTTCAQRWPRRSALADGSHVTSVMRRS
jgi:hypothetical protein